MLHMCNLVHSISITLGDTIDIQWASMISQPNHHESADYMSHYTRNQYFFFILHLPMKLCNNLAVCLCLLGSYLSESQISCDTNHLGPRLSNTHCNYWQYKMGLDHLEMNNQTFMLSKPYSILTLDACWDSLELWIPPSTVGKIIILFPSDFMFSLLERH